MAKINLLPWRLERRKLRQKEFYTMLGATAFAAVQYDRSTADLGHPAVEALTKPCILGGYLDPQRRRNLGAAASVFRPSRSGYHRYRQKTERSPRFVTSSAPCKNTRSASCSRYNENVQHLEQEASHDYDNRETE